MASKREWDILRLSLLGERPIVYREGQDIAGDVRQLALVVWIMVCHTNREWWDEPNYGPFEAASSAWQGILTGLGTHEECEVPLRNWLFVCARKAIRADLLEERYRASLATVRHRREARSALLSIEGQDEPISDGGLRAKEAHLELQAVLGARLEPSLSEPFLLSYLDGMTSLEVARALGLSLSCVVSRLQRARRALGIRYKSRLPKSRKTYKTRGCSNCPSTDHYAKGLCHRCYHYRRKHGGRARPPVAHKMNHNRDRRVERVRAALRCV